MQKTDTIKRLINEFRDKQRHIKLPMNDFTLATYELLKKIIEECD